MKKNYLFGFLFLVSATLLANSAVRIKINGKHGMDSVTQRDMGIQNITSVLTSNNNYVANTTMNLKFILKLTNTDGEYGDSLSLTFPAGVTPNSSPNQPIGPDDGLSGSDGPEILNGVFGQSITWGNNDNGYGGIVAGTNYPFTVNVTIGAGYTGPMVVTYFVSGDAHASAPADFNGAVTVNPAAANDIKMLDAHVPSGCGLSFDNVVCAFTNFGTDPATNFNISYSVNGGTPVIESYTNILNPGDTDSYTFTNLLNMTNHGFYNVLFASNLVGDGYLDNDTIRYIGSNTITLTSVYKNSFEKPWDREDWLVEDVDGGNFSWQIANFGGRTGSHAMFAFEGFKHGPGRTSDDWLFTHCIDMLASNNYMLVYWKKREAASATTPPYGGGWGVSIGQGQTPADMTQTLKPFALVAGSANYSKDSLVFQVPSDGLYNIGFRSLNTDTTKTTALFLDDIAIRDLGPVGINELGNTIISLYPNPSNGVVNFTTTTVSTNIEVYNSIGAQVYSKDELSRGEHALNLSILPSGLYSIKASSNNKVETEKVMIKQ